MKRTLIAGAIVAALALLGAGCTSNDPNDQDAANKFVTGRRSNENLSDADKNLKLNRWLTPTAKTLDYDILDCPTVYDYDDMYVGATIYVWKLKDGKCYPGMQFKTLCSDKRCACKEPHYHDPLTALDGTSRPNTYPCGTALESDVVATGRVWVSPQQYEEFDKAFQSQTQEFLDNLPEWASPEDL